MLHAASRVKSNLYNLKRKKTSRMVKARPVSKRVLDAVRSHPMSISALATKLKIRREFLAGYLAALADLGRIKPLPVGKALVYVPKK